MFGISTGIVSDALLALSEIYSTTFCDLRTLKIIHANHGVDINETISFISQCGWLSDADPAVFTLSNSGLEVVALFDGERIGECLWQKILASYIKFCHPAWASRIPYGRQEAFIFMRPDEKRCFREANLMGYPPSSSVIEWWDNVAADIRKTHNLACEDTGRDGEKLTLDYELQRTRKSPIWVSLETNLAGFDIISIVDRTVGSQLLIEVKNSSQQLGNATMIISRNEWEVALSTRHPSLYMFYVWYLNQDKMLAKLFVEDIAPHVPKKQGNGSWKSFEIPFSTFQDRFIKV